MKKGFTLVELLAVLTLLAFVAIIATPIMEEILDNSSKKTKDAQVKEIIEAAKKYVIKYDSEINYDEDNEALLMLSDIKKSEFLNNEAIINAETNEEFNGCVYIKYNENTGKTSYAYFYSCETLNDTSGCFDFSNNTIYGFDNENLSCQKEVFTLPTFINGEKVRNVEANDDTSTAYFIHTGNIDFTKALFLENIGNNAFNVWTGDYVYFKNLDLSNNSLLTEIGDSAFCNNSLRIDNVILPDNLKIIKVSAFRNLKMKKLILPGKLERISKYAFKENNLEKIEIPSSVNYLDEEAFANNKLISVTINGKSSNSDFSFYSNPFPENNGFNENKIIWKK